MKFIITEWYEDCLCPSGNNDHVVHSETIEASSAEEAEQIYQHRHEVGVNNVLKTEPVRTRPAIPTMREAPTAPTSTSSSEFFARRAADALAYECAKAVRSGRLDGRSGIADALLDYLNVGGFGGPLDVHAWMENYERDQKQNTNQT